MSTALPEVGQLVDVRGARWVVTDVAAQGLPRSSADDGPSDLQHAVTMQAMGDDRYGDELRVVWELEPGTNRVPERGLPHELDSNRIDEPATLAAFVDALRWGAVTSADPSAYQAPFRSGATVEAYQLEPLRRALLAPRTNLLLADDVGLGKTIEAGLVVQELLLRHRARSVVVVCPAGLVLKWQDEMAEKFGLSFEIINSETMRDVRRRYGVHANPFVLFPRVIVSMSWLPSPRAQRLVQAAFDVTGRRGQSGSTFDVLVVDEAHHVAPSAPSAPTKSGQRRAYAVDSQRTLAVRDLARHCEHRLFLSATPHNGYPESFTALLEMVDDHRFARGAEIDRVALAEVAVRRLKSDLVDSDFRLRRVEPLGVETTEEEQQAYGELVDLLSRSTSARAADGKRRAGDIAALLLKKRFLSSPWAFARTAAAYLDARRDGQDPDLPDYDDVLGEDAGDEEEGRVEQPELDTLVDVRQVLDEMQSGDVAAWEALIAWGRGYEARADARLDRLRNWLDGVIRPGGHWSNERVVVFTEYVDTLDWIRGVLQTAGYGPDRLAVIHGQTPTDERELIRLRFNAEPDSTTNTLRVLLATDAAGEGIDLQRHCHRLVNYDVPFNPNRLEQRIGRIDRYGQEETPVAYHFVAEGSESALGRDVDLLRRLVAKMQRIRSDLGSANEVLAPDVENELLGRRPRTTRSRRDASDKAITEMLRGERALAGELTDIATDLRTVQDRLHLHPYNLSRVVDTALALAGQPVLEPSGDEDTDAAFEVPTSLGRSWLLATADLDDKLSGERRRITFDQDASKRRDDLVYAHLGHPLVRLATRSLRQELWDPSPSIHRVTAVVVPDLKDSFVAAVTRMVLVGGSGVRLHEEVFLAGTRLRRRQALGADLAEELLADALDGEALQAVPAQVLASLVDTWNRDLAQADGLRARVELAVEDRAARRQRELRASLSEQESSDLSRVEATFVRFRNTLERSITVMESAAAEAEQQLFEVDGSTKQRRRDISEVRRRLDALEDELDRERAAVMTRYESATPHPFAGAVVFALTPADVEELGR